MSASSVRIRAMVAADVDCVLRIQSELPSAPQWARQAWVDAVDASLRRIALVAVETESASGIENSGEIFGFAVAGLLPPEGELEVIAVSRQRQRGGLGRMLLAALLEQVGQAGVAELALEVRGSNAAAIGLYRAFGFSQAGSRVAYYTDPVEDAVLMRLKLG